MRRILITATALFLFVSGEAHADWHEASSDHFVIYADENEKEIRKYSDRLERYYSAMTVLLPSTKIKPSPSNRVTIYVVRSERIVRKLYGSEKDSRYVQGFYIPRAGGSIAIIPPIDITGTNASESEHVLMHEYAHHFMAENTDYLVPRWYGEGFAEYFSTARFEKGGAVGLGLTAVHRAYDLFEAREVSIERLLDSKLYASRKSKDYDSFYGRSWLLFHYLYSESDRRDQIVDYLNRLNGGEAELAAATAAFGNLKALDKSLDAYMNKRMLYWRVPAHLLNVGPVVVRRLSEGEAASMSVRIRSKRGVDEKTAAEVVIEAREVAAKYPDEPAVQAALAEAEFDAGDDEAAIRAADKALAKDPGNMTALIQKGYALTHVAQKTKTDEAWKAARRHFVSVNKIENDHPIPLINYYLSFLEQGKEPTKAALDGLEWALELAPYDVNLRMMVARQEMKDKRLAEAIRTISPVAYNPHLAEDNPAIALLQTARDELAAQSTHDK
jgi:Flp pilus assembly protein TadD